MRLKIETDNMSLFYNTKTKQFEAVVIMGLKRFKGEMNEVTTTK